MISLPLIVVFLLIGIAVVLFVTELVPHDVTAISIIVSLALLEPITGVSHRVAISGFASTATITILAMYMLSAGIHRTGLVQRLGYRIAKAVDGDERRALIAMVGVTGPIAGFVNNTPIVAVFVPMVIDLADQLDISPSKLLLPLSYAAILGGTLTLIGTSTNLIASDYAVDFLGRDPVAMFEFTALGVVILVVGAAYLIVIGPWLVPAHIAPRSDLIDEFDLEDYLTYVRVRDHESLVDLTLSDLEARGDVRVLQRRREIERTPSTEPMVPPLSQQTPQPDGGEFEPNQEDEAERPQSSTDPDLPNTGGGSAETADPSSELRSGDILTLHGSLQAVNHFLQGQEGLQQVLREPITEEAFQQADESGILAKLLVPPDSALVGKRIEETHLRSVYDTSVLAVRRKQELIRRALEEFVFAPGDVLLVQTYPRSIGYFYESDDLVVVEDTRSAPDIERPSDSIPEITPKAPIAIAIMVGVIGAAALGVASIVIAALGGVVAMILTGCLTTNEAYEAVSWNVIFLLAGVIPLGFALAATGGAELIASGLVSTGAIGPLILVMFLLYIATGLLANVITPVASAVLMIPVAIEVALQIGANEFSFLLAVMFASATSFMTPIGYQTNLMVYGPGGYSFIDFLRVGAPLQLLLAVISTIGIVFIWGL